MPRRSYALQHSCDSFIHLEQAQLLNAQFPATLSDITGTFNKPPGW